MAHHDDHHVHGTMPVRDHERTFAGFIRLATWGAILSILAVIFMALANA